MSAVLTASGMFSEPRSNRMARLLGLNHPETVSEVDLARRVGRGLPFASAEALFGGLAGVLRADDVIPEDSLTGPHPGDALLSREHSERIYELSRVLDAALRAYRGDHDRALEFLSRPHPLLDGESPIGLAQQSSAGVDAVVALIGRATAGVAV